MSKQRDSPTLVAMAKKKKKGGGGGGAVGSVKGFGAARSTKTKKSQNGFQMDRSKDAMAFYDFLAQNGAGDNLQRAALGYFALPGGGSLRGVVALKDMKKGDVLIRIPYELAINLGLEGVDPTGLGKDLLQMYCDTLNGEDDGTADRSPYFRMLPEFMGDDCRGSTDFFSEEAMHALQAPLVVEETQQRRERVKKRFERDVVSDADFPKWTDGSEITEEHLRWAVWLITSRVLTVQGAAEDNRYFRLLIPFLDMCNHDRASPHVLTGRAVAGGELKVVAGAPVAAGEQINIGYGGGVAGNDRFLQDYGFLDSEAAFNMVALQILGKRRVVEGVIAGRTMPASDREAAIESLQRTTVDEDKAMLLEETSSDMKAALQYRIGVKEALSKYSS